MNKSPNFDVLRRMRRHHMAVYTSDKIREERSLKRGNEVSAAGWARIANMHMEFVQTLNDFFEVGDNDHLEVVARIRERAKKGAV